MDAPSCCLTSTHVAVGEWRIAYRSRERASETLVSFDPRSSLLVQSTIALAFNFDAEYSFDYRSRTPVIFINRGEVP